MLKIVHDSTTKLCLLLILGLALQSSNRCFAGEAVLIVQEGIITGLQNVYVSPKALRIDNQKTGTTIVSRAPAWEVDLYNKKNRTMYHTTTDKFKASFFQGITKVYRDNLGGLKWKKEGPDKQAGLPAIRYAVHLNGKLGSLELLKVPIQGAYYWLASDFKIPPKACNVLSQLNSLPLFGLLPIQCTYIGINRESSSPLFTQSVKKISVVDPFFDIPKFDLAPSERDVFIDPAGRAAIEGMFGDPK
jgi:hypothetical protein